MHNRSLGRVRAWLLFGLFVVFGVFQAADAVGQLNTGGVGYIFIDENLRIRPLMFWSDTPSATVFNEAQGQMTFNLSGYLIKSSIDGGLLGYLPPLSSITINVMYTTPYWQTFAMGGGYYDFSFLKAHVYLVGHHPWRGLIKSPFDIGIYHIGSDSHAYVDGVSDNMLSHRPDAQYTGIFTGSVVGDFKYSVGYTCYKLPSSLNLTSDYLNTLPWGWWGNPANYTVDANYNVTAINVVGTGDNPNFPPSIPINPLTGKQYTPDVWQWVWDPTLHKWVGHNKYTDATAVPTQPGGPTGGWRFGRNPRGNVHNPNPEGSEWYWDGTEWGSGISQPPSNTDNPFTGATPTPTPIDSTQQNQLLSLIEQNTRSTASSVLGLSTAIPGFRSEVHGDLLSIRDKIAAGQVELMSCLNGHHHTVEYSLSSINEGVSSLVAGKGEIISALSSGFGGVVGALANNLAVEQAIKNEVAGVGANVTTMAGDLRQIRDAQGNMVSQWTPKINDISASASAIESQTLDAVEGLDRIDGHLMTANELIQQNLDMWASQITHWNESSDHSLAKLQYLCDVGDSLKAFNEGIADDSNHMRLFWELEKIRWIARDEKQSNDMDKLNDGTEHANEQREETNNKLDELIDAVAGNPPEGTPEIDLSGITSRLDLLIQAVKDIGKIPDFTWLKNDLATIKLRLSEISNALNARATPEQLGEVELDPLQEEVRDDLQDKLNTLWDKLTSFETNVKDKFDYSHFGGSPNPEWIDYQLKWGVLEADLSLDWRDEKWSGIMQYKPLWFQLEIWSLWVATLMLCYKALLEV